MLQLEGLSAGYDAAVAVRDLDLHVGAGEVVALLGPNGAGKTTTLRAISGLIRPMAGVIRVDGDDLAKQSPAARAQLGIAHVPEGRGVFFGLTVAEHFRLGYRGERLDADVAYTYFPALAALRDRRAGLLSGGEQQMLTLGVALARKPRLMLVDELSLGLAPVIVERLMPVVSTLCQAERLRPAGGRATHPHRLGRRRPGLRALTRRAGDPRPRRRTARRPPADPVRLPRRTRRVGSRRLGATALIVSHANPPHGASASAGTGSSSRSRQPPLERPISTEESVRI